jgi:acetyl-CoA synthetase
MRDTIDGARLGCRAPGPNRMETMPASDARAFLAARDQLLALRGRYDDARRDFAWPALEHFNWALDYFDPFASGNDAPGLVVLDESAGATTLAFAELSMRSSRAANFLRALGARRGDALLLMLGNVPELWVAMLAAMKLGLVIIPATTLLTGDDLRDRFARGGVRHVITDDDGAAKLDALAGDYTRVTVGAAREGWVRFDESASHDAAFEPDGPTRADDPFLLYFTSGTTALPKLVLHTQASYPVGHLTTMYWIGLGPGDVHWNISSPGWAKHAWSCFFAPWNAGAAVFIHLTPRFSARRTLEVLREHRVSSLCAPPTVWRMVVGESLGGRPDALREVVSAGEPLNPEVIERVQRAWGLVIRDGYGQTETTAQVANPPGAPVEAGSMGRPMPGFDVALLDAHGYEADEGEICLRLDPRPMGLMVGYADDPARTAEVMRDGFYHTGDVARRDARGYVTYVGRADDVFKSSDYRISPFELESLLIEHELVAEAAVVPSPDPVRLSVPKAFVVLRADARPSRELALDILRFARGRLAPYKRIRRLEFAELPKTISGKIRRVELRHLEEARHAAGERGAAEFREDDFPELRASARE